MEKGRCIDVPEDVIFHEVEGETVLLDLSRGTYYGFDGVATRMWKALLGSSSISEACAKLLEEFEVEPETLQKDLEVFLEKLETRGLARRVDG